jgi:methyl-accepting chemotaxis protein
MVTWGRSTVVLDNAILAHHVWKSKLKAAISSKSQVDATSFGRDDCCEIGQWLYGEGAVRYGSKPEFVALVQKHKSFHLEAGKVATEINAQKYAQASRMIESGTAFASASLAVAQAVEALKRTA